MENGRRHFARDFEHDLNHQQEALRGGERAGHGTGLQRTVNGAGLALHFHDLRNLAENVRLAFGGPFTQTDFEVGGACRAPHFRREGLCHPRFPRHSRASGGLEIRRSNLLHSIKIGRMQKIRRLVLWIPAVACPRLDRERE